MCARDVWSCSNELGWGTSRTLKRELQNVRAHLRFVVQALACAALVCTGTLKAAEVAASIEWSLNEVKTTRFRDLAATNWPDLFLVYVDQGKAAVDITLPPIAGTYRVETNTVIFTPQFPFVPGVDYHAVLRGSGERIADRISRHRFPAAPFESKTTLLSVFPTADSLPENLLKFYLQFSAPMSGGHIYEHIHLRDASGKEVALPFLEIDEELWDPAMTRLTLFLDPGRIKRGVKPLEDIGPALQAGKSYTLKIARDWKDANGAPLIADYEKTFAVVEADREPPNPKNWKITAPRAGTRETLKVNFDERLDHALIQRVLKIIDSTGAAVAGAASALNDDTLWTFVPKQPWGAGRYRLFVPTIIEDLAGNNIGKAFDVDLERDPKPLAEETVQLGFTVQ
jgi:hypothetical protein